MANKKCYVSGCLRKTEVKHWFPFPREQVRCRKWVDFCQNAELQDLAAHKINQKCICDAHFKKEEIMVFRKRVRLDPQVVPSLNGPVVTNTCEFTGHMSQDAAQDTENSGNELVRRNETESESQRQLSERQKKIQDIVNLDHDYDLFKPVDVTSDIEGVKPLSPFPDDFESEKSNEAAAPYSLKRPNALKRPLEIHGNEATLPPSKRECRKSILRQVELHKWEITPKKGKILEKFKEVQNRLDLMRKSKNYFKVKAKALKGFFDNNENLLRKLSQKVSPTVIAMLRGELNNSKREKKGQRWTLKEKLLYLSIMKRNKKTYRFLKSLMTIPSEKTLARLLRSIRFKTGTESCLMLQLPKTIVGMSLRAKYCVVLFDEMQMRESLVYNMGTDEVDGFEDYGSHGRTNLVANHALVFMARGLNCSWKQPVCYFFSRGTTPTDILSQLIVEVCEKLIGMGLRVLATICDQGPTNVGAMNSLMSKNSDRPGPYFRIGENRILVFYDPPHLLKNIRNRFYDHDIKFVIDGKAGFAKWQHLKDFYEADQGFYRMAQSLTDNHLDPTGKFKMKVSPAAQVLSHTVYAGMGYASEAKKINEECMDTSRFVKFWDSAFDSFNGSTKFPEKGKKLRCWVTNETAHQEFWNTAIGTISRMVFVSKKDDKVCRSPPCHSGWMHNIRAISQLRRTLQNEGVDSINMRHLNQDPLECFFGGVRANGEANRNPNVPQFVGAVKTIVINKLSSSKSKGTNCQEDGSELLSDLHSFVKECRADNKKIPEKPITAPGKFQSHENVVSVALKANEKIPALNLNFVDHDFSAVQKQATEHVAGYIIKRVVPKDYCSICNKVLNSHYHDDKSFISRKEYTADSLVHPSAEVVNFIAMATKIMLKESWAVFHLSGVKEKLKAAALNKIPFQEFCGCRQHKKQISTAFAEFLARFVIFTRCKRINRMVGKKYQSEANAERIRIFQGR